MGLSDRLSHIKINSEKNEIEKIDDNNKTATTTVKVQLPNEHVVEDCGTCTLLGVDDTKNKMFQFMNTGGADKIDSSSKTEQHRFWEPLDEPVDAVGLGNSGWNLLHTIAAYYPEKPDAQHQEDTRQFLQAFSKVYPCKVCAKDFQEVLTATPARLQSQHEFAQWMCEAHNHVNKILGKPEFDCDQVDKRWKRTAIKKQLDH
ncbi:hypothetical protein PPL_02650 [Heterostelium album PN500]|uniref:Sulfhydryl oxidase n=1 Tax=Heterostelium pallidum (strain ATCC 26659 / Pp 5 / PN500) TaxID=670386 RepID=D3B2N6_HETP5|nr:hypothetical protein PPL_02650 [Heterostelium album PN500]EFA83584.1 hypothetical protein PPL_02650 [Heterostelium album PN500]|eukprot:XP_020435701.1 hypothetical protein PPL_02650 [Heterostelium album PN500]